MTPEKDERRVMWGYEKGFSKYHIGLHLEFPSCEVDPCCVEVVPTQDAAFLAKVEKEKK